MFIPCITLLATLSSFAAHSAAFPTLNNIETIFGRDAVEEATRDLSGLQVDAVIQKRASGPIDVSGTHAFAPPNFAAGDQRGPCPGLNALANHNYLPRNGVASFGGYIAAVHQVYGMGIDIGTLLSGLGTAAFGNALSVNPGFSMGGSSPAAQNILGNVGGLVGNPAGLSGSHGGYEQDSSGTRGDLYQLGDNVHLQMSQFMELYNMQKDAANPQYSIQVLSQFNKNRFQESISKNPYFFYPPVGGLVVRNAAYGFVNRLFSNFSSEYGSEGHLSKETLKSFFSVTGPEGSFVYTPGCERIPENWYPRPTDYTVVNLVADLVLFISNDPNLLNIGGNTGTVNSFTGINISDLTGGVFNAATLLEGNNLLCFALSLLNGVSPDLLHSIYATITGPLSIITGAIGPELLSLNCPQVGSLTYQGTNLWQSLQNIYPGAKKAGGGI